MTKLEISVGILATVFCFSVRAQTVNVMTLDQAGAQTVLQAARESAQQGDADLLGDVVGGRVRPADAPEAGSAVPHDAGLHTLDQGGGGVALTLGSTSHQLGLRPGHSHLPAPHSR